MKSRLLKLCSVIVALALLIQLLPMQILGAELNELLEDTAAEEAVADETILEDAEVLAELTERRTEYTKEYKLSNGLSMAVVYPQAVHYEEDGQWKEIDNTLISAGNSLKDGYTNTAGPWQVNFPRAIAGSNAVSITKDGYTLQFYMSGQLLASDGSAKLMTATAESGSFSVDAVQASLAEVVPIDLSEELASAEHPEAVAEKIRSRVQYTNVFDNTDVVYDLISNQVKESIVMDSYHASLRGYRYSLTVDGLTAELQDSGEIVLSNENGEAVMVMPAPYLVDSSGEYCGDVTVTLVPAASGSYTLSYILPRSWLASNERQWPVILDPIVSGNTSVLNIQDVSVYEQNCPHTYKEGVLDCGHNTTYGIMRSYIQFSNLPDISSADVIVGATITLEKTADSDLSNAIEIHEVTSEWSSNAVFWNSQPSFDTTIEDYAIVQAGGLYTWNITDIVRSWYQDGNNGLMIKAPDSIENTTSTSSYRKQFYSVDYSQNHRPQLAIYYRNTSGLESYWDYTSASAGRAGTGHVNNYSGNLVWVRSDIGFGGNLMPVSISHVYNTNDSGTNEYGMGYGWRTNYNQTVKPVTVPADASAIDASYVWTDGDGTKHYFIENSDTYVDEDGLELTLTVSGSGYTITDKYENKSVFNSSGYLTRIVNNQKTPSSITVSYTNGRISKITDGVGRVYNFTYTDNLLTRISYVGKGSSELSYVTYGYTNSELTSITDKDGESSLFEYDTGHFLTSAQDTDGYKLRYFYSSGESKRVITVAEYDGTTPGGTMFIEYVHNQTTLTDHNGNIQIMQFNDWGNTVSIQDGEGRAKFAQYAWNDREDPETVSSGNPKANQLRLASKMQNTVVNLLTDTSFESDVPWSGAVSASTDEAYMGSKSMLVTATAEGVSAYGASVSVPSGKTLTFSAYVKTGTAGASLGLGTTAAAYATSEELAAGSGWTRLQVSYTNNGGSAVTLRPQVVAAAAGTVYLDCVQAEFAPTASRYNMVENGDFLYGEDGWTRGSHFTTTEVCTTVTSAAPQLSNNVYKITGNAEKAKHLYQRIYVSGNAGDTYVLSAWAKGDSVPLTGNRQFSMVAYFNNTDGTRTKCVVQFNPDADSSISWQYAATAIVAKKAYTSINIDFQYDYNVNSVYVDGIQLFKEEFGSSYTYDADGNIVSVTDLQKQTTTYEYTENDLTKIIQNGKAKLTYTYDDYHNVISATTEEGVAYAFTYDDWGNNTSVDIVSDNEVISSTATYTADHNRLETTTDALANVTTYCYNENTNVLEWVQYPEDTYQTRLDYSYDTMYRLATVYAELNTWLPTEVIKYTYTDDLLASIQTTSTTYNFTYGDYA